MSPAQLGDFPSYQDFRRTPLVRPLRLLRNQAWGESGRDRAARECGQDRRRPGLPPRDVQLLAQEHQNTEPWAGTWPGRDGHRFCKGPEKNGEGPAPSPPARATQSTASGVGTRVGGERPRSRWPCCMHCRGPCRQGDADSWARGCPHLPEPSASAALRLPEATRPGGPPSLRPLQCSLLRSPCCAPLRASVSRRGLCP